jgi:hypothetical protein
MSLRQLVGFTCLVIALTIPVAAFEFVACRSDFDAPQGPQFTQSDLFTLALLLIGCGAFAGFGIAYLCLTACNSCHFRSETIVARWQSALNRLANRIQDVLIEGNFDGEPSERLDKEPLPALDTKRFVDALDRETDELLAAVVDAINQAPNATTISELGPKVRTMVAAWTNRAVVVGEKLRIDAAVAELPPLQGPHTNWSRKYRRMKAGEGELAPTPDD